MVDFRHLFLINWPFCDQQSASTFNLTKTKTKNKKCFKTD